MSGYYSLYNYKGSLTHAPFLATSFFHDIYIRVQVLRKEHLPEVGSLTDPPQ